ncbi:hypothetical protein SERLA73DRAFT_175792 [Serpula lacrymans var. lacrymans S7.3]|uniref:Uncharacterized protein n=1 Tax=Serpula lacrymans var. lacrymans (strain S7.3) TaxID=936435 RepID=F8PIW3_SERL3|nr:hypothetical protein SERLA73DRAFT_175792 [Serpula lacrymans var. lacrymans S7.3]
MLFALFWFNEDTVTDGLANGKPLVSPSSMLRMFSDGASGAACILNSSSTTTNTDTLDFSCHLGSSTVHVLLSRPVIMLFPVVEYSAKAVPCRFTVSPRGAGCPFTPGFVHSWKSPNTTLLTHALHRGHARKYFR